MFKAFLHQLSLMYWLLNHKWHLDCLETNKPQLQMSSFVF